MVLGVVPLRGVPRGVADRGALLVAEVVGDFALQGALDERLGELPEQAVITEQVFRLLIVFQ